ncbi:variant erythrocyte surface antigen-1 family protein [Babesia caballi]|uniref:Variant erythrocyte surface antigen-1 family protein n=1 Tax=Babesia caballi TaxID=5871 RepID=A0AAV4M0Q9_BABCB|nr:variant erythrocyte surface antigen-1 family protein [Babesia caballi]
MTTGKSLTDAPTNLKEAMDWVLRMSGRDSNKTENAAIKGLAEEVIKLLDKDAGEVAQGVLRVMGETFDKVIKGLKDFQEQHKIGTTALRGLISRVRKSLQKVTDYGSAAGTAYLEKLRGLLQKDVINPGHGPIGKLADGLKKFVETNNGIFKSQYEYVYNKSDTTWPTQPGEQQRCAYIFLGLVPLVFYFLSDLYYWCEGTGGWSGQSLSKGNLKNFMESEALGFKGQLNQTKNGSHVANILKSAFSELNTGYEAAKKNPPTNPFQDLSYGSFIRHYERLARAASFGTTSDYPLKKCFAIATPFFTPNSTHRVQSTSPATPSFAGYSSVAALAGGAYGFNLGGLGTFTGGLLAYPSSALVGISLKDCPSNLKEAIDWLLRVTGKDGGGGYDNEQKLAAAIVALPDFKNAINAALKKQEGVSGGVDISQALAKITNPGTLEEIITKLADGLRQFIGYDPSGKITGAGIAPSNMATHRLCDATIAFTIGVLEGCKKNDKKVESISEDFIKIVDRDIGKLYQCYGKGAYGLKNVVSSIHTELSKVKETGEVEKAVKAVGTAFQSKLSNATDATQALAGEVGGYIDEVVKQVSLAGGGKSKATHISTHLNKLGQQFTVSTKPFDPTESTLKSLLFDMSNVLRGAVPSKNDVKINTLRNALYYGKENFMKQLEKNNYASYYSSNSNWQDTFANKQKQAAQIFLSCIPFLYIGLSHLYWQCRAGGPWSKENFSHSHSPLRYFVRSMGYDHEKLVGTGATVTAALTGAKGFSEFNTASSSAQNSFTDLLKTLRSGTIPSDNPLSALFLGASCYFQSKHSQNHKSPSTIRQTLYWLSGLTVTPQFGSLLDHFDTVVPNNFQIAISGILGKDGLKTIFPDNLTTYLVTCSLTAPAVLAAIQGPGTSDKPLIHDIFSNAENLDYYSTTSTLFNKLSDCAYALQFQLGFLYRQCRFTYGDARGWQQCKYGGSDTSGVTVHSYLCPKSGGDCSGQSPLQAFLTDNLRGFSRGHPSGHSDHLAQCPGVTCHVPMGFNGHLKGDQKNGEYIYDTLLYFCGDAKDSLNQLCDKLSCLTKRTPRSLGDLFGFTWQLTGQLFNKDNIVAKLTAALSPTPYSAEDFIGKLNPLLKSVSPQSSPEESGIVKSLQTMGPTIPFLYQLFTVKPDEFLPVTLFNLNGNGHKTSHHDIASLQNPQCTGPNCGPYLSPLTYSTGSAFAPKHASTYFSWLLYLADDFEAGLRELLDEFKTIKCTSDRNSTHWSGNCSCNSVAQCGGFRPLLYANGFNLGSAYSLMNNVKRTCQQFHSQLQNVITGNPLNTFLTTIDTFLYAIRWEFFSKLSSFWTIYIGLILYTFFFLLDALHIRSHLKFNSSHTIPPLALLTSGKPPAITKLTYITQ